jgi:hypothetical protein
VLAPLVNEDQIFSFKFWFNSTIQYGMFYNNELFCRLKVFDLQARSQAYQLGSKLVQQDAVIILTCTPTTCSLWGSLRSPLIKEMLLYPVLTSFQRLKVAPALDTASAEQPEF